MTNAHKRGKSDLNRVEWTIRASERPKHVVSSLEQDKGKAKIHEYEDSDGNESAHSLDSEYGGLDVPIMRTPGAPHHSTREKNVVSRFGYNAYMAYHYAFMMNVATVREPKTFFKAAKDPPWVEAINEEMQTLSKNKNWDLVPSSHHQEAIRCWWIFKVKHNVDDTVNRYTARLVAKCYVQTHGVDYEGTFASVANMTTIRTVIPLATAKG